MKCIRCNQEFDSYIAELNAENYGSNYTACTHCGKLYKFYRSVSACEVFHTALSEDSWGVPVVSDEEYKSKQNSNLQIKL